MGNLKVSEDQLRTNFAHRWEKKSNKKAKVVFSANLAEISAGQPVSVWPDQSVSSGDKEAELKPVFGWAKVEFEYNTQNIGPNIFQKGF